MTAEEVNDVEGPDLLGAIDQFLDGEPVDVFALDAALASEDGRAYLMDVVSLREAADGSSRFAPVRRVRTRRDWLGPLAAAAALTLAVASGYVIGHRGAEAAAPVTTVTASNESDSTRVIAPKPTIVLTFDPGPTVDWKNTGSN